MALLISTPLCAAQPASIEWVNADGVRSADRNAIVRLARRLGIREPRRITFDMYLPSLCQFVRVESRVSVDGPKRTWQEVMLRQRDWPECTRAPWLSKRSEGRWIGSRIQLTTEEAWRIADGDWFVDVSLGSGVPYDDAERIVLAIRHGTLVNRLPSSLGPLKLDTTMPSINADAISSIQKGGSGPHYSVQTGARLGLVLDVRVENAFVELHGVGTWMVQMTMIGANPHWA